MIEVRIGKEKKASDERVLQPETGAAGVFAPRCKPTRVKVGCCAWPVLEGLEPRRVIQVSETTDWQMLSYSMLEAEEDVYSCLRLASLRTQANSVLLQLGSASDPDS